MARLTYAEMAAEVMDHIIDHDDAHGYSQPRRKGDGTAETLTLSDGTRVQIHGGDYDCSEAVRMCYAAVGVLPSGSYMWTGTERELLAANGFDRVPLGQVLRGDVLWRQGHTEMYLGGGMCGGARLDEVGGITGPRKGDQTGQEIARGAYKASAWSSAWRCTKARPGAATGGSAGSGGKTTAGAWRCVVGAVNVRTAPSTATGRVVAQYRKGGLLMLDGWSKEDGGIVWARYTASSGAKRYVALSKGSTYYWERA